MKKSYKIAFIVSIVILLFVFTVLIILRQRDFLQSSPLFTSLFPTKSDAPKSVLDIPANLSKISYSTQNDGRSAFTVRVERKSDLTYDLSMLTFQATVIGDPKNRTIRVMLSTKDGKMNLGRYSSDSPEKMIQFTLEKTGAIETELAKGKTVDLMFALKPEDDPKMYTALQSMANNQWVFEDFQRFWPESVAVVLQ